MNLSETDRAQLIQEAEAHIFRIELEIAKSKPGLERLRATLKRLKEQQ